MDEDLCGVYVKRIEENAEIVLSHCLDSKLLKNRLSSSFVAEDVRCKWKKSSDYIANQNLN